MGAGDRELSADEMTPEALERTRIRSAWKWCVDLVMGPDRDKGLERFFLGLFWIITLITGFGLVAATLGGWQPFGGKLGSAERLLASTVDAKEKSEIIRNLFFAAAGLVGALGGLFQLYNSARRTRINALQSRTAFEAERNDRFVKAAELLKEDSQAVQISGIYALQRLAEEESAGYRKTVVLVLAGFVRAETGPEGRSQWAVEQLQNSGKPTDSSVSVTEDFEEEERPSECVAAAIDALMALTDPERGGEGLGELVDLRRCRLAGLDQPGRQMIRWRLDQSNLEQANLVGIDLTRAYLTGAHLSGTYLRDAVLTDAVLYQAAVAGSDLQRAVLLRTDLAGADLVKSDLTSSTVRLTDLVGADLTDTKLGASDLAMTKLVYSKGLTTAQLAQARNVNWPDHVPRPESGPYAVEPRFQQGDEISQSSDGD